MSLRILTAQLSNQFHFKFCRERRDRKKLGKVKGVAISTTLVSFHCLVKVNMRITLIPPDSVRNTMVVGLVSVREPITVPLE